MRDLAVFRKLTHAQQMQVCVGVLLDGLEAADVLATDAGEPQNLKRAARELASLSPDVRVPLVGTLLRTALEEIEKE